MNTSICSKHAANFPDHTPPAGGEKTYEAVFLYCLMLYRGITVMFNFYNRVRFSLVSCRVMSLSILFPVRSRVEFNLGSLLISVS